MTRGFITIATGKLHYYKIAANLLLSYRYFTKDPLPFAIIAEEENEYTALFDDVILTNESYHSFLDKFLLLKLCPYDETIFIDADCLAYDDLNKWWTFFDGATDFSAVGHMSSVDDSRSAWYNVEDLGEYGKDLPYKCQVHAGVCYIKNTNKVKRLYDDCMELYQNYDKMHFHSCPYFVDECVFGVAMPRNGMKTTKEDMNYLSVYPFMTKVKADIWTGELKGKNVWKVATEHSVLMHFGTYYTHQAQYRYNVEQLQLLLSAEKEKISLGKRLLYKHGWRLFFLRIGCGVKNFGEKIKLYSKKLKSKLTKKK